MAAFVLQGRAEWLWPMGPYGPQSWWYLLTIWLFPRKFVNLCFKPQALWTAMCKPKTWTAQDFQSHPGKIKSFSLNNWQSISPKTGCSMQTIGSLGCVCGPWVRTWISVEADTLEEVPFQWWGRNQFNSDKINLIRPWEYIKVTNTLNRQVSVSSSPLVWPWKRPFQ